ncbi:hypothetical protein CLV51_1059 [Chitinophaga niastensis]|uniref:Uncharacterized protein n=1 Tax=Chitinophaga niastensis TaxID=536980 RepID=A0A2P8HEI6_CHINA|nr:hypothetical protein CLV51_1059 [Chitinophaga niastensis]
MVQPEDCKTEKIYLKPNDRSVYEYDQMPSLGLTALQITIHANNNS